MPAFEATAPQLSRLLLRQRVQLAAGLVAICAVSWAYLAWMNQHMHMSPAWVFVMWIVMMTAMMLPTAAPMVAIYARFQRGRAPERSPVPESALFAGGYLVAWAAWSGLAAALQIGLTRAAALHPMAMKLESPAAQGSVLLLAGVFQLTPLKNACLSHCRSPVGFFMTSWREGRGGALVMGLSHGLFCIGCCWALMALMFAVGCMNMLWIAGLTGFVLLEKLGPFPRLVNRASGLTLIAAGAWLLLAGMP